MRAVAAFLSMTCTLCLAAGCSCLPCLNLPCLDRPYLPAGHAASWDPVLGSCDTCGVCGGGCQGHTPASYLKHQLTCGSGCGEIYWGEWLSDPPDDCDPCDDCGNWIGPRICDPGLWEQLVGGWCDLWGFRSSGCASCATPCATCGGGCAGTCGGAKGTVDFAPLVVPPAATKSETIVPLDTRPSSQPDLSPAAPVESVDRSILRSTRF